MEFKKRELVLTLWNFPDKSAVVRLDTRIITTTPDVTLKQNKQCSWHPCFLFCNKSCNIFIFRIYFHNGSPSLCLSLFYTIFPFSFVVSFFPSFYFITKQKNFQFPQQKHSKTNKKNQQKNTDSIFWQPMLLMSLYMNVSTIILTVFSISSTPNSFFFLVY